MAKKDYFVLLVTLGIVLTSIGFFGELYALLKSTLVNQVILGAIFIIGVLMLYLGIKGKLGKK